MQPILQLLREYTVNHLVPGDAREPSERLAFYGYPEMAFPLRIGARMPGMPGREILDLKPGWLKFLFQKGFHAFAPGAHADVEA